MSGKDVFGLGNAGPGSDAEDATRIHVAPARMAGDAFDDPDNERTVIGRFDSASARAPAAPPMAASLAAALPVGPSPLVAAATRLLMLSGALHTLTAMSDPKTLRDRVGVELDQFVKQARQRGVDDATIQRGHYALCALIDDVVMATPWGVKSGWSTQSLVARHHNEVVSGERMLHMADQVSQPGGDPGQRAAMAQLLYLCFSLGFEGRLRIDPRGRTVLSEVRDRLHRTCRELATDPDLALSTHWAGVDTRAKPLRKTLPLWVWFAGAAGLASVVFSGLFFALASRSSALTSELVTLTAPTPRAIVRDAPAPVAPPSNLFARVQSILAPDIAANRVVVVEGPRHVAVRLTSNGLFGSGSAALSEAFADTIIRIGEASKLSSAPVEVVGHSDNAPITGRSLAFPDNMALSKARATAVDEALGAAGLEGTRVVTGVGETQPVADNATAEGKAENRRVEVLIFKENPWDVLPGVGASAPLPELESQP